MQKGIKHGLAEVGDIQYDQVSYLFDSSFEYRNLDLTKDMTSSK